MRRGEKGEDVHEEVTGGDADVEAVKNVLIQEVAQHMMVIERHAVKHVLPHPAMSHTHASTRQTKTRILP